VIFTDVRTVDSDKNMSPLSVVGFGATPVGKSSNSSSCYRHFRYGVHINASKIRFSAGMGSADAGMWTFSGVVK
jgi:hypothetical protein